VFRRVLQPTHDQLISAQLDAAVAQRGKGDLQKLLRGGETWQVE
jgi:2-oxoglutarate ferredoxin oxidoreductase subunit beta